MAVIVLRLARNTLLYKRFNFLRLLNMPLILPSTIRTVLNNIYRKNGFSGQVYNVKYFYFCYYKYG